MWISVASSLLASGLRTAACSTEPPSRALPFSNIKVPSRRGKRCPPRHIPADDPRQVPGDLMMRVVNKGTTQARP